MDEERVAPLFGWVPQLFFDLIGRVVPGIAVMAMFVLCWFGPFEGARELDRMVAAASLSTWIAWLVAAYLVGLLFGTLGSFAFEAEWRLKRVSPSLAGPDLSDPRALVAFMYDAVLLSNPPAGARMAKLSAELHLSRVLILGGAAMAAVAAVRWRAEGAHYEWLSFLLAGAVALTAWAFSRHIEIRRQRLLVNLWRALNLTKKLRVQKPF